MIRRNTVRVARTAVRCSTRSASIAAQPGAFSFDPKGISKTPSTLSFDPVALKNEIHALKQELGLGSSELSIGAKDSKKEKTPRDEKKGSPEKPTKPEETPEQPKEPEQPEKSEIVIEEIEIPSNVGGAASSFTPPTPPGGNSSAPGDKGSPPGDSPPATPPSRTFPPLLAIPMSDRPPIPGRVFSIYITDPEVIRAVDAIIENKHPHFLLFHSKSSTDSDVIESKESVHEIGTHCDLCKVTHFSDKTMLLAYPTTRVKMEDLTTPNEKQSGATKEGEKAVEEEPSPTAYLSNFKVSYATSEWVEHEPYDKRNPMIMELTEELRKSVMHLTARHPSGREQVIKAESYEPHELADFVASLATATPEQMQEYLETLNIQERLEKVLAMAELEKQVLNFKLTTIENMRKNASDSQSKAVLKEFVNQFNKLAGLSEKGTPTDKAAKYTEKIKGLKLTAEAQEAFDYELGKLQSQHESSGESYVIEKYLDWLVSVPWGKYSKDHFNIKKARATLERDHYGLDEVKQRILEFISMGRISGNVDGKILCLAGPPGTGKTSIAKSIAEALNRQYVRIAMGGVNDMHELKGHRRTYVGAVPGRIILALKQAKTSNPLMLIDEIDKLDTSGRGGGGASSAFLEILDPEQNHSFTDNYLDVKVDLSKVLFVCTANYLGNISPPLRDRMEIIDVSGYTTKEKVEIAQRHLIPQAAKKAGLENGNVVIPTETITRLIERYCRESGLRNAKKQITRIFSKAAFKIVEQIEEKEDAAKEKEEKTDESQAKTEEVKAEEPKDSTVVSAIEVESKDLVDESATQPAKVTEVKTANPSKSKKKASKKTKEATEQTQETEKENELVDEEETVKLVIPEDIKLEITPENLKDYIGPEVFPRDRVYDELPAGVATGLSYSGSGNGDALYIESILTNSISSGTGNAGVRVTGSLKDVMKESASISYSFAKSFLTKRFPKNRFFEAADIHVHCPDGAVPKDGPSAGISFTSALVSLAINKPLPATIAMTGELTVTGRVLAVGGLREKILGAKRYGCTTIIFPKDIENVLDDIPEEVKEGVEFIPVEWYHEVFDKIFPGYTEAEGNQVWDGEFAGLDKKKKDSKSSK
ncbi:lon protease homolog, mitochondrial [[Candida] anglica]|uniref:Lon protease homolog, mitochondrial n=1 Tax=[Candida] anglica TaxID=148631 RepID=A0ABP0EIG3_9ASCO